MNPKNFIIPIIKGIPRISISVLGPTLGAVTILYRKVLNREQVSRRVFHGAYVTRSKRGMITINPEFPHEQSPELFSIILLIYEMILKKRVYITRIEESLRFYSIERK